MGKTVFMKKFLNELKQLFLYTPPERPYNFSLPEKSSLQARNNEIKNASDKSLINKIVPSLDENITNL